jgi:hydroxymethylpyrimidine pyrophosphatase-like HAD family hydrolase
MNLAASLVLYATADEHKMWYAFDFDGTLAHDRTNEPVKKMIALVKKHLDRGDTVKVLTARVHNEQSSAKKALQVRYIQDWCERNVGQKLEVTNEKDPWMIRLYDDKAIGIRKNTGEEK